MKLLFKQDLFLGIRALVYALFAVLLMLLDHHSYFFHTSRNKVSSIITPLQYVMHAPAQFASSVSTHLISREKLLKENNQLQKENLLLNSKLQELSILQQQNTQLQKLLKSSNSLKGQFIETQILMLDPAAYLAQMVIDKGAHAAIKVGEPVLDAYGVVGQIVQVDPWSSRVMLLTDRRSAIPVQFKKDGYRAVAVGDGAGHTLYLHNVPQTEKIKVGDELLTSGLGQRFPVGYPVGKVVEVVNPPGEQFARITLAPAAHLHRSRLLLVYKKASKGVTKKAEPQS